MNHLTQNPNTRIISGPCGALRKRLQLLNWRWLQDGQVMDHDGLVFHLIQTPIQWLHQRIVQAWRQHVGQLVHHRNDFDGLAWVDPHFTCANLGRFSHEEAGLLRVVMNGTFFTRDKQYHSGHYVDKQCPWCNSEDSVWRRHWECAHFHSCRQHVAPEMLEQIHQMPDCAKLRGWMTRTPLQQAFVQALDLIADTSGASEPLPGDLDQLHLFVDGTCLEPSQPTLRLAAWAVCVADANFEGFPPIASGGLPGYLQTILRAEITATMSAIQIALKYKKNATVWTDSQIVHDQLWKMILGNPEPYHELHTNHDLWQKLSRLVLRMQQHGLRLLVAKVVSHLNCAHYQQEVELWAIRGNTAADSQASFAIRQLPGQVLYLWNALRTETQQRARIRDAIHDVMVAIGKIATRSKDVTKLAADDAWDEPPIQTVDSKVELSFHPLPVAVPSTADTVLNGKGHLILQWLK